jgi:hypothetical protein
MVAGERMYLDAVPLLFLRALKSDDLSRPSPQGVLESAMSGLASNRCDLFFSPKRTILALKRQNHKEANLA